MISALDEDPDFVHVAIANENDAITICAGAWLCGKETAFLAKTRDWSWQPMFCWTSSISLEDFPCYCSMITLLILVIQQDTDILDMEMVFRTFLNPCEFLTQLRGKPEK